MLTTRLLPADEWDRLDGHEALGGYPLPPAEAAQIVVTEDEGSIVGVWVIVQVLHLEPAWVEPSHRGGLIVGRMWRLLKQTLRSRGARVAFAFADRDDIRGYLGRLGLQPSTFSTFIYQDGSTPCHTSPLPPPSSGA
jgi:hypothetical protein